MSSIFVEISVKLKNFDFLSNVLRFHVRNNSYLTIPFWQLFVLFPRLRFLHPFILRHYPYIKKFANSLWKREILRISRIFSFFCSQLMRSSASPLCLLFGFTANQLAVIKRWKLVSVCDKVLSMTLPIFTKIAARLVKEKRS